MSIIDCKVTFPTLSKLERSLRSTPGRTSLFISTNEYVSAIFRLERLRWSLQAYRPGTSLVKFPYRLDSTSCANGAIYLLVHHRNDGQRLMTLALNTERGFVCTTLPSIIDDIMKLTTNNIAVLTM